MSLLNTSAQLSGSAKLEQVTKLMDKLSLDLQNVSLLPNQRDALLEQLKIYGRDPTNSDPIFTKEGIEVLTRHAFNSPSRTTSRNALRCLANAMLLKPETRKLFLELGYEAKACTMLKNDNRDDEFLVSRILFLTTYIPGVDIERLVDEQSLADIVCTNICRHAAQYTTKQKNVKDPDPMREMALSESLKLLFNLTHFAPESSKDFLPTLPHVLTLLANRTIPSKSPLDQATGPLINALINIPLDSKNSNAILFPKSSQDVHINKLIDILDKTTSAYHDEELEQLASPLLALLRKIYEIAPSEAKQHLRTSLLPSDENRQQPLGKGSSLPARLLQLSTNPITPQVKESVSNLLFELSDKDAQTFVQNVGYGFASGFLFGHRIPIPENALEAWSTHERSSNVDHESNQEGWAQAGRVNPITGQLLEKEPKVEEVKMTPEEQEREAERMFVLFERLKKNGVINVENPVAKAYHEGRFQELDDDADSD